MEEMSVLSRLLCVFLKRGLESQGLKLRYLLRK